MAILRMDQDFNKRVAKGIKAFCFHLPDVSKVEDLFQLICIGIRDITALDEVCIGIYCKERHTISFPYFTDQSVFSFEPLSLEGKQSHALQFLESQEVYRFSHNDQNENLPKQHFIEASLRDALYLPLYIDSRPIGFVAAYSVHRKGEEIFDSTELMALSEIYSRHIDRFIAQSVIEKKEKLFRRMVEENRSIVFSSDERGIFNYISPAVRRLTGYTSEEIMARNLIGEQSVQHVDLAATWFKPSAINSKNQYQSFGTIIHPKDRSQIWKTIQTAIKKRHGYSVEYRIIHKDGSFKWVQERADFIKEENTIEGVIFDIDARKKSEDLNIILVKILHQANLARSMEELFCLIPKVLLDIIHISNFQICLWDKEVDTLKMIFCRHRSDQKYRLIENICEDTPIFKKVLRGHRSLVLSRSQLQDLTHGSSYFKALPDLCMWMGAPLVINNEVIGVITGYSKKMIGGFQHRDFWIFQQAAHQIAIVIDRKQVDQQILENEKLILKLSRQTEELSLSAASLLTLSKEEDIFYQISKIILTQSDYNQVVINYFTDAPPYRKIVALQSDFEHQFKPMKGVEIPLEVYEKIFSEGKKMGEFSYFWSQPDTEELHSDGFSFFDENGGGRRHVGNILLVKMQDENGKLIGLISVDSSNGETDPTVENVRPLEIFSTLVSQIITFRKTQRELQKRKREIEEANLKLKAANKQLALTTHQAQEMAIQAKAATRSKSEFLANMSHEIRTPMNVIIGFTNLAIKGKSLGTQKEYLKKIKNAGKSLLNLINDILDLSKIEAGKLNVESEKFSLLDMVEILADMFSKQAADKGIELIFSIDNRIPNLLFGDTLRIRQVLINLLNNAVKFTETGEVLLKIKLKELTDSEVTLSFSVIDTGIGIPDHQYEVIFKSFSQADSSTTRKYGGTGLGLTICQKLVYLMGGEIIVEKNEQQGSTFSFDLTFEQIKKEKGEIEIPYEYQNKTVLIVDDNKSSGCTIQDILSSYFKRVEYSNSAESTLRRLTALDQKEMFDLLIIDYNMPEVNGLQLIRHIRQLNAYVKTPIILMTAYRREEIMTLAEKQGVNAFAMKPIKLPHLLRTIEEAIAQEKNDCILQEKLETSLNRLCLKGKILIVDDDIINQQVTLELLRSVGIEATIVENGQEAVYAIEHEYFSLVLMDIQMPIMDGYEATQKIRQMPGGDYLPIIAMTAFAMKGDREKCLNAGMDDYISKPVNTEHLFAILQKWLPQKMSEDQLKETNEKSFQELKSCLPYLDREAAMAACTERGEPLLIYLYHLFSNFKKALDRITDLLDLQRFSEAEELLKVAKEQTQAVFSQNTERMIMDLEGTLHKRDQRGGGFLLVRLEQELTSLIKKLSRLMKGGEGQNSSKKDEKLNELHRMYSDLMIHLIDNDIEAESCFFKLKSKVIKPEISPLLAEIEMSISELDYERAKIKLKKLTSKLDI